MEAWIIHVNENVWHASRDGIRLSHREMFQTNYPAERHRHHNCIQSNDDEDNENNRLCSVSAISFQLSFCRSQHGYARDLKQHVAYTRVHVRDEWE